jgi:hypothetical protein
MTRRSEERIAARRGWRGRWSGRAPRSHPSPAVWRATTAQLAGLSPFLMGAMPPPVGVYIGYDTVTGAALSCHPAEWLHHGIVTNPNLLITGLPGAGKSSTIKALVWRLAPFGTRAFVPGDIKGEYGALAEALGGQSIALGPGLPGRVNPLDPGPGGITDGAELGRRRLALLASLAEIRLRRRVNPFEEQFLASCLRLACGDRAMAVVTIPDVLVALRDPSERSVSDHRVRDLAELRDLTRDLTAAVESMVAGTLGGLFDGPTTIDPDWTSPLVSLDVSRLDRRGDEVVAAALSCLSTWGQAAADHSAARDGKVTIVIRDELWRWLALPGMVRKIDSDLRLSRAEGTIQLLATHRLSDFDSISDAHPEEQALARALVASCHTRLLLAQDLGPLRALRDEIGLTDDDVASVASWGAAERGRALWKIGTYGSYEVQMVLAPDEIALVHTNERMRA